MREQEKLARQQSKMRQEREITQKLALLKEQRMKDIAQAKSRQELQRQRKADEWRRQKEATQLAEIQKAKQA